MKQPWTLSSQTCPEIFSNFIAPDLTAQVPGYHLKAMLFFLVFSLLSSPACSAQEMQGPGGGSYFYIKGEEQGEIQGIRIFVGMMGLIKGIQLRFGEGWSPRYGARGGRAQEFLLWSGERITAVAGSARACIRHLSWSTSRGRQVTFGRPTGGTFSAHPSAAGQQLLSVNGQHRLLCLSGIGFKWGPPPKKPSAQGPAAVTGKPATSEGKGASARSPGWTWTPGASAVTS